MIQSHAPATKAGSTQATSTQTTSTPTTNSAHQVLVAEELRKSYGSREALRGLSFSLQAGRILGFLGPNGAGKTTAIRILTTILSADSGHFVVDGISSEHPESIRRKIGVLPESLGFPKQITGIEYLTFFGQLYGRSKRDAREYGLALLEEIGLHQRGKSLIGGYSRGMRQRLGIARALINDPAVVFLDEPTLGLDPRGQQELLALVQWIAHERNAGVILCSHLLSEIEDVCDDVLILRSGQIIAQGTVSEVIRQAKRNVIQIHVPVASVAKAQQILAALPNITKVTITGTMEDWLVVELADSVSTEDEQVKASIVDALVRAEIPVLSFGVGGGRLQDVFLQLTEEVTA
jgi:ABC-2 type transport system ATP-binding protein